MPRPGTPAPDTEPPLTRPAVAPALTLVMPAFNEEGNVDQAVRAAGDAAAALVRDHEIVIVDDGSRDGTAAILAGLQRELGPRLRVVRHPTNLGYGVALRDGFQAARGELVFYTDSDNQFDLRELADVLPLMRDHDAVLGFRLGRRDPPLRKLVSAVFNGLASLAFGMAIRDLNCSFKLFRRERLQALRLESDDFFIDTELVARIHRGGWRYVQHGVRHYPRRAGRSSVRPRDVPKTLVSLARMWLRMRQRGAQLARDTPSS